MTLQSIFTEGARVGGFPYVQVQAPIKNATSQIGQITEITKRGVGVRFPGLNYSTWFHWDNQYDKRTHHVGELTFVDSLH